MFSFCQNSHVEFIRRLVTMVSHNLARVVIDYASPHYFFDIPTCIEPLIINELQ